MTPSEVVADLLELLERPDLESLAFSRFYSALQSAHKVERLRKDLYIGVISDPSVVQGKFTFVQDDYLPRCREVRNITLYKDYIVPSLPDDPIVIDPDKEIPLSSPFVDLVDRVSARDYYGIKYPHTYTRIGSTVTLSGVSEQTKLIAITYLGFPSFSKDPISGEYESDSWILREFPQLVQAFLRQHLATVIDSDSIQSAAMRELAFQRQEFIGIYAKDAISY